jgi:hypothetical protein
VEAGAGGEGQRRELATQMPLVRGWLVRAGGRGAAFCVQGWYIVGGRRGRGDRAGVARGHASLAGAVRRTGRVWCLLFVLIRQGLWVKKTAREKNCKGSVPPNSSFKNGGSLTQ